MKRGVTFLLIIFLVLIGYVIAQQGEFSVRFHSFGKNASIDLKQYLGESELYLASQSLNVITEIDQEKGIATITAKPGWEGSEVIYFRTNESLTKVNSTEEIAKFLPVAPEILYLRRIRDEELTKLFEGTIDPSVLDLIKEIKKEEITKLSKEIRQKTMIVRVNDEVDLKLELGYTPAFSMDFSLGAKKEGEEAVKTKETGLNLKISNTILIIAASILCLAGLYFYRRYSTIKIEQRKEWEIDTAINKDIKRLNLNKLMRLQKDLGRKESSDEFIRIVRDFFSNYFGIEHDFEFKHLTIRVRDSDLGWFMKNRIISFLNDLSKTVYYPSEKWTEVYGQGQIPKSELKKLITKLRKIIRSV